MYVLGSGITNHVDLKERVVARSHPIESTLAEGAGVSIPGGNNRD